MKRLRRVLLGVTGFLLVLLVVAGLAAAVMIRRPFPKTEGVIRLPGLQEEVHVYRDALGVPHIYASTEHDLFMAQGYVHAQDRFWQMEFWRHVSSGRISEIVGETGVNTDKFIRTMGWNRIAASNLARIEAGPPELLATLEAYSEGVNAYIDAQDGNISINYSILSRVNGRWAIEPWQPLHSLAWSTVMANDLSVNWRSEISRAEAVKTLGAATVESLTPEYDYERRPVIAPTSELRTANAARSRFPPPVSDYTRVSTKLNGSPPSDGYIFGNGGGIGSNNWVISGEHTDTGMPLLANDPHLGIQMPAIWYEVGLHTPGRDIVGFSLAGIPGVVIGHNNHIAWGMTNVGTDVQDLYIEKINPANPNQYEYMGQWRDMEIREEVIKVNGGAPVTLPVRITRHGPIITELVDNTTDVLALRWTGHEPSTLFQSLHLLNRATNYEQFREALRYWDLPSQNFVYADVEGHIAYQVPGRVPIRRRGDGLLPVPGWTDEYEWDGWIPYEKLPALLNPAKGYIVTANHAVVDRDYPYLLAVYWDGGDRGQRITELIEGEINGDGVLTAADIARMQLDSKSLLAETYMALFKGLSSENPDVQAALTRLRSWGDLQLRRDSVPAALFEIFRMHLAHAVLGDDVGRELVPSFASDLLFHQLAREPESMWWDKADTEAAEAPGDIILEALSNTVDWFKAHAGDDMNEWTWGRLHTATFVSAPLGQTGIGLFERLVNRGPFPVDGGNGVVNTQSWRWSDPARVVVNVSMRMIVDISNFDASRAILPTGQSGHPYHRNYADMIPLWLNGEYHPMLFTRPAVEAAETAHLVLRPQD